MQNKENKRNMSLVDNIMNQTDYTDKTGITC